MSVWWLLRLCWKHLWEAVRNKQLKHQWADGQVRRKGSLWETPILCAGSAHQPRLQVWITAGSSSPPTPLQVSVFPRGLVSMCFSKCWDTVSWFCLPFHRSLTCTWCRMESSCAGEYVSIDRRRKGKGAGRGGRSSFEYWQDGMVVCARGPVSFGIICYMAMDNYSSICWVRGFSVSATHHTQKQSLPPNPGQGQQSKFPPPSR